jgi:hypothetical protein
MGDLLHSTTPVTEMGHLSQALIDVVIPLKSLTGPYTLT